MLDGIRIIEIEGTGPGPFAAMFFADLGADVIVVPRPGDHPLPGIPDRPILDRGKRAITLDLKDASDRAVLGDLLATADGLIEAFRPGVMERLGFGPGEVHAINPALVYGRLTGWGQDGPLAQTAGHDMNFLGRSGAMWLAGMEGTPPFPPPTLVGDIGGGAMYLVAGMLAGLLRARATGQGTVVDAAIFDGSAHMTMILATLAQTGAAGRGQSMIDGAHFSRCYRTGDGGWIAVQALEPKFYAEFLSRLSLSDDPDFARQFDNALWPMLAARLEALFAAEARAHWETVFAGSDACVAPVLRPDEALLSAQNQARGVWQVREGALQAAPAPRFSGQAAEPGRSPGRGEHSAEIRAELRDGARAGTR